jgi:hypothetical protein
MIGFKTDQNQEIRKTETNFLNVRVGKTDRDRFRFSAGVAIHTSGGNQNDSHCQEVVLLVFCGG